MHESESSGPRPISLEDLIALNGEIAALVRAGVPLELGLRGAGSSLPRRLGELTDRLSQRLSAGSSLPDALSAEGDNLPPVYRAVVRTGLRVGRLPEALESLTALSQSVVDLRQKIGLALVYPGMVFLLAYGLLIGFLMVVVPQFGLVFGTFQLRVPGWLTAMRAMSETVPVWGPIVPIVVLSFALPWLCSNRFAGPPGAGAKSIAGRMNWISAFGWLPWMRRLLRNFHLANFSELLALLTEHEVPLPEAILLAAETTGDRRIARSAARIAADVESGRSLAESLRSVSAFPPFMRWLMINGERQAALTPALRQITEVYRRRAELQAEWFKLVLPIALVAIVGGGATLAYGLTLFVPLTDLLKGLS